MVTMVAEAAGAAMVLAVIDGAVRWVVYFLIWASLPGFEEVHRKTAPDTEPETHLAMLVECLPGARGQGPEQRWIPTACIVSTPFPQNVGCRSSGARCVLQTPGQVRGEPQHRGTAEEAYKKLYKHKQGFI